MHRVYTKRNRTYFYSDGKPARYLSLHPLGSRLTAVSNIENTAVTTVTRGETAFEWTIFVRVLATVIGWLA